MQHVGIFSRSPSPMTSVIIPLPLPRLALPCFSSVATARGRRKSGLRVSRERNHLFKLAKERVSNDLTYLVARFSAFFWMRRRTYSSSVCSLAAARISYSALSEGFNLASFAVTLSSLALAFLALDASTVPRLRFFSFMEIFVACIGASVSDAEVGGVLVPDGGSEVSVAELSSIVPAIASPFTKNPYRPPRLMPCVRIWLSVLCVHNQHSSHWSNRWRTKVKILYLLPSSNTLQTLVICSHPPLVVSRVRRLLLAKS